jgi:hypothetical protein
LTQALQFLKKLSRSRKRRKSQKMSCKEKKIILPKTN